MSERIKEKGKVVLQYLNIYIFIPPFLAVISEMLGPVNLFYSIDLTV